MSPTLHLLCLPHPKDLLISQIQVAHFLKAIFLLNVNARREPHAGKQSSKDTRKWRQPWAHAGWVSTTCRLQLRATLPGSAPTPLHCDRMSTGVQGEPVSHFSAQTLTGPPWAQ